ncbi:hypothetical protein [Paracoccus sanguinis]|uniref:Flagellar protein FliL n=1 Tax=Paracoccus sanguinis TaxID=1545044 RepID=A0A099GKK8_9RHOB|nr:hypothetical protein [Paracoccus sanguinis]KGJ13837.1 hypothetical protein IX54_09895 [Paracoccus sanguinis]KGJ13842.1 hypothetical protein IX54_09920 [Paracoccus sanguinis]KGJ22663.1 hypothetical protein IX56_06590 [Paracoccus sanguinis]
MIRKLLPILLILVAFLGGAAGGDLLHGRGEAAADAGAEGAAAEAPADGADGHADTATAVAGDHGAAPAPAAGGHGAAAPSGGHEAAAAPATAGSHGADAGGHGGAGSGSGPAWFKFPQQFFVPVLHDGRLDSTMVLSLSVEMPGGATETVYAHELKLRDALLRQMLIHANTGGFDGNFTAEPQLRVLRQSLLGTAQGVVPEITDILIGDIARQER